MLSSSQFIQLTSTPLSSTPHMRFFSHDDGEGGKNYEGAEGNDRNYAGKSIGEQTIAANSE